MQEETIIITTGKKSSCLKETKFGGDPKSDCISVHIGYPETVTEFEGHPHLYTESEVKAERLAGQYEAWALAQKILNLPCNGGYTAHELTEIFCGDGLARHAFDIIKGQSYSEAAGKINAWEEKQAETFHVGDVVKLHWHGVDDVLAVVTWTKPDSVLLGVVIEDGNVDDVCKDHCIKIGKLTEGAELLAKLKKMKEEN